jgi:hypothetical protein
MTPPPNNARAGSLDRPAQTLTLQVNHAARPALKQACEHLRVRMLYAPITSLHFARLVCRDCGQHVRWIPRLALKLR